MPLQILAQVSGSLEIMNVTKDKVIFSDDFESFLESLQPSPFGQTAIGKSLEYYQSLFSKQTTHMDHIQARIPFELNIR